MRKQITFSALFVTISVVTCAQANLDSLKQIFHNPATHDTTRLRALSELTWEYAVLDMDSLLHYTNYQYDLARTLDHQNAVAISLNNFGIANWHLGHLDTALRYFNDSRELNIELGDRYGEAGAIINTGAIYSEQGNLVKAIQNFTLGVQICEEIEEYGYMANAISSMGGIYVDLGDYDQGIHYYERALEINRSENDDWGASYSMGNIANIYLVQDQYEKALPMLMECLDIQERMQDPMGQATSHNGLAVVYKNQGDFDKALTHNASCLDISTEYGLADVRAVALTTASNIYSALNNPKKAIEYGINAFDLASRIGDVQVQRDASFSLFELYKQGNQYRLALNMHERYIETRDSLISVENHNEVIHQEYKYAYEKQADSVAAEQAKKDALAAAEKRREADIAAKEAERKNVIIYSVAGGLVLVVVFTLIVLKRLRITRRQKVIIEQQKGQVEVQKHEVEEKNKEILDSINYAKRLQEAILPPGRLVKEGLPNSFVLYQPKDIVAGDFYWMETIGNVCYFAAADCTGHGVPGAMVSVVCSNALSKALIEESILEPSKILDRTRELVIERFERSEEEVKDGMDISLCALNKETNELMWAGANNPLWILRNNTEAVEEFKADKQPIGKYDNETPFTNHVIPMHAGDTLYIFSDGYPDQFGGEKGKKYKSGKFKKKLASLVSMDMPEQMDELIREFENWRGDIEQIDDVCIIGVRV